MPFHHTPLPSAVQITRPVDQKQAPQFVAIIPYLDVGRVRFTRRPPSDAALDSFNKCCKGGARLEPGKPSRYFVDEVLTLNLPQKPAWEMVAELPGAKITYLEPANEFILPANRSSEDFHDLFNQFFAQSHHEKYRSNYRVRGTTSYSTKDYVTGHSYRWYAHRPSKISGQPNCFKWEGRHQGERAVGQIGVHNPKDCINFDFEAYRNERLRLYELDWERFKRYHHNRQSKSRLRESSIPAVNDWRVGIHILHRILWHPDFDVNGDVQRFIDVCGRGPFLTRITMLDLLEMTHTL
jgi:hypothetical protein